VNIELLKEARICDVRELTCRVQISYSDIGKAIRIASGIPTSAGMDGILGIYEDSLVCYELSLFNTKPTKEVFRLPFKEIKNHELKKGFLGLSYVMQVETENRRYKLVATLSKKTQLEAIMATSKH